MGNRLPGFLRFFFFLGIGLFVGIFFFLVLLFVFILGDDDEVYGMNLRYFEFHVAFSAA